MSQRESIPVIGKDGTRGWIVGAAPSETGAEQLLVEFETGARVLVPRDAFVDHGDGRYYYLPLSLADIVQRDTTTATLDHQPIVLPVIEETAEIEKRIVEIGRVHIQKLVHERDELIDEPIVHEEVEIDRVPVNRVVESAPQVRQEGDTLIIPVLEEVLVVEKRLMLREEVRVLRRKVETHQPQHMRLRTEEVIVERTTPEERTVGDGTNRA